MTTKDLYLSKKMCCGCEACSQICPKHIITVKPDEEGFLYPYIDDNGNCIKCKRCLAVCPVKSPGRPSMKILGCFGGYVNDKDHLKESSSGGFSTEICKRFIELGGVAYGVRYSNDYKMIYYDRADEINKIAEFRTSKYSQAGKQGLYGQVIKDLKEGRKVLFVGLPCEVSAVYHFVGNLHKNLYTISLICHGPTSPKVHYDYCSGIERRYNSTVSYLSLRYKLKGWKPYYIKAVLNNGKVYQKEFSHTSYGVAFQYLKRPSCSVCKYKTQNGDFGLISDVTLGDFHSVGRNEQCFNEWGVSQVCVQSDKGAYLLNLIGTDITFSVVQTSRILNSNIAFHKPIPEKEQRPLFSNAYVRRGLGFAVHRPSIYIPYYKRQIEKVLRRKLSKFSHFVKGYLK